jgi:hypothetical protein
VRKDCVVLVLQSVVEGVVPLIEENINEDDPEVERDDSEQKPRGSPAVLREPEWASYCAGIMKELAKILHPMSKCSHICSGKLRQFCSR